MDSFYPMIFSLFLLFISSVSSTVCPIEWNYFDGICWKFDKSPRSFDEAEKECRSHSGELVSPKEESHNEWIDIITTPYVSLPYKPDCFERELAPAWIAPRIANHLKVASVQECLAICASARSLLQWECTRIAYDNMNQGCLLFGSSPGEGEKMGVDRSFEVYNNLCWMEESTKNEVVFPDEEEDEEESSGTIETINDLKMNLISMKQIDSIPITITAAPSVVPTEQAFRPVPAVSAINLRKCFRRIPQGNIPGRADDIYQNISSTECLEMCLECNDCLGDDLPCMSVIYYDLVSECILLRFKKEEGLSRLSNIEESSSLFWRDLECGETNKCNPHMDLIIILDGSDSIGIADFEKGIRVIQKLMNSIRKLTKDARVRVFQIGEGVKEEIPFSPINENTEKNIEKIEMIGGRSLLGATVSQVIKNTQSETSKFILISDLFIEDNPKLIEIELNKYNRHMITLSLTEVFDKKIGDSLTMGDVGKMIHSKGEEEAEERLLRLLCHEREKREKRQTNLLETRRVWIGLRRTIEGELIWTDKSTVNDLSRLSDIPTDDKKCVSSEMEWSYTECEKELPFVCTFTPLEKLESLIQRSFTITSLHMPQ